jgi:hypothetical protein
VFPRGEFQLNCRILIAVDDLHPDADSGSILMRLFGKLLPIDASVADYFLLASRKRKGMTEFTRDVRIQG